LLFNSLVFVAFAMLFFGLWPLLRPWQTSRWLFISAMSFFFYGWWDWRYLLLLIGTGLIDFFAGWGMERHRQHRRELLCLSLCANLGTLAFFKYSLFFAENIDRVFRLLHWDVRAAAHVPEMALVLPVGISFYTFQSMSYSIDVYRGHLKPTKNVLLFFSYLALFPQLVAGPIVRASDFIGQLLPVPRSTAAGRWAGLQLIVTGYFKKMVIADNLAPIVNTAFLSAGQAESAGGSAHWWVVMAMFAVQIYCDFSGYTDIARGLANWMGYSFMENFDHPYLARSIREFWSRWHISLSTWFRDYVYIPLGGSHGPAWRGHLNLFATFILSGFWHGASWRFVTWGALHGAWLSLERVTQWPSRILAFPGGGALAAGLVLTQVLAGWVFFRAASMREAFNILRAMFSFKGAGLGVPLSGVFFLAFIIAWELSHLLSIQATAPGRRWRAVRDRLRPLALACMITACVYLRGAGNEFIYFQF
jgi:D-alanyl-lipoteichoic acid acyltransferase DltB (MBOAT superfamily)